MRADLGKDPAVVAAMFNDVAAGYDRTNAVLSFGQSALWRMATTRALDVHVGHKVLDVAAGTGTSSAAIARSGAQVIAADFSAGMIAAGRRRLAKNPRVTFVEADATKLPFADGEFDAVTISFGLRNVQDPDRALREFLRVTKPGGRLVVCEFSTPRRPFVRQLYRFYQGRVMPIMARWVSSNPTAYDYLGESIAAWPGQAELARRITDAGWAEVRWRNLSGGIVALHRAVKPHGAPARAARATAARRGRARLSS